ncbi:hypothetical protein DFH09DRAFT_1100500 [Mycena vulgaris]|nr:hypothetical protein DFH09DRAFT_1100500 [Mycena vulgaris]
MCIQCAPFAVLYPREDRKPEYSSTKKKEIQRGIKQWRAPNGYSGHVAKKNPWVPSALLLCLCICGNWTARAPHDVRIGQLGRHALGMGSDKGARVLCCVVQLPEILRGQLDLRSQITLARRPPGGSRVRSYAACIVGFGVSGVADGEFESRGRGMLSLPRRRHAKKGHRARSRLSLSSSSFLEAIADLRPYVPADYDSVSTPPLLTAPRYLKRIETIEWTFMPAILYVLRLLDSEDVLHFTRTFLPPQRYPTTEFLCTLSVQDHITALCPFLAIDGASNVTFT